MRPVLVTLLEQWGLGAFTGLVPTSGAVYVAVFLILGLMFRRRAREAGLGTEHATNLWIIAGISGALGARLYFLAFHPGLVPRNARSLLDLKGTASWGVYLGVALALGLYSLARKLPVWQWLDLAVAMQLIGESIGRWACWLAGDDFGRVTQVPWAIRFPRGSLAWTAHVASGRLCASADWSLPVHPQQFYLMANAAILLMVITALWRRTRDRPGLTFATYLVLYGASRFGWEFFRDPAAGGADSGLSSSQWMCVGYVVVGGLMLLRQRRGMLLANPDHASPSLRSG